MTKFLIKAFFVSTFILAEQGSRDTKSGDFNLTPRITTTTPRLLRKECPIGLEKLKKRECYPLRKELHERREERLRKRRAALAAAKLNPECAPLLELKEELLLKIAAAFGAQLDSDAADLLLAANKKDANERLHDLAKFVKLNPNPKDPKNARDLLRELAREKKEDARAFAFAASGPGGIFDEPCLALQDQKFGPDGPYSLLVRDPLFVRVLEVENAAGNYAAEKEDAAEQEQKNRSEKNSEKQ